MIRFEQEITINRTPAEVFDYISDPDNLPGWQGTTEVTQITDGPVGTGTRFTEVHTALGRRLTSVTEVTTFEPARRFAVRIVEGPVPVDGEWTLEPAGDGATRLRFVASGEGPRLMGPLIARQFRKHHDRLRQALEAGR
jgi:uncharacterized protein YndB with AHSA1/START domain